jgi:hypothetical protein
MIITLRLADFSKSNIGTLSSWRITRSLGSGATYEGATSVDKGAAFTATVTLAEGYEIGTAGVTVTMGGTVLNGAHSISGNVITITIAEVTGNVLIKVPTVNTATGEEEEPDIPVVPDRPEVPEGTINAGLTLYQGYVDNKTLNNQLATRVRTDAIQGPCKIEVNEGYLIRAIYEYSSTNVAAGGNLLVPADKGATSYTYQGTGYIYVTFCKKDATQNLLPTEDIVKVFSTDVDVTVPDVGGQVEVSGIGIDLGQLLDTGLKQNAARAYTVNNVNDKTTFTTTGDFVMIPTYDNNDIVGDGLKTFYTHTASNTFSTSSSGGTLKYHSTINVNDLKTAAPDKFYRIMFKRNDGAAINLTDLQAALTIV